MLIIISLISIFDPDLSSTKTIVAVLLIFMAIASGLSSILLYLYFYLNKPGAVPSNNFIFRIIDKLDLWLNGQRGNFKIFTKGSMLIVTIGVILIVFIIFRIDLG